MKRLMSLPVTARCAFLFCIACAVADATAQDVMGLRGILLDMTGDAYVDARAEALALSDHEFAELLAPWQRASPTSIERITVPCLGATSKAG